jgi:aminoglycoside phosphotransferase (APT) family kinase protein
MMSHTHRIDISGDVVTKTYVDWSRNEHLREWTALQVISAAKPHLVPVPIRLARPALPVRSRPSITMGRLPGSPLTGFLTTGQLEGLQVALVELWSIPPTGVEPIEHAAFVERIRQSISAWNGSGIIAKAHLAAAEWLAGPTADELEKPLDVVIGHGDPNLANYLWDGGHVRIIDFEDAGQSDLACELANLVEHVASRGNEWTAFLERFAVKADRLRAARCLFATFWLTLLRPGGASAHRNPAGTAELQAERVLSLLS